MRIISGKFRGRKINPKNTLEVRPTTDMAKESLFNILNNNFDYEDLSILDLFAGTGSISYEFISRGCQNVTSVEINARCIENIIHVGKILDTREIHPVKANVFNYLKSVKRTFDIIFADPPYDMADIETIPELIFSRDLLNKGGWFILEHSENYSFSNYPNFHQHRKYGKVNFTIFNYE